MNSGRSYDAVIVGGGLAGTTVAAELALGAPDGFRALVIEAGEPGPGTAYSPVSDRLYMNGTAQSMSAVPGDKLHLVRWLRGAERDTLGERALIPRSLFGRYLTERFYQTVVPRSDFEIERAEVVDLVPDGNRFTIVDGSGGHRNARDVILALGNFPPDDSFLPETLRAHPGYVPDPWRFEPSSGEPHGDVLVIGSGLTGLDAIALLDERGFTGTVHLVSRHGLLACTEDANAAALDPKTLDLRTQTPLTLLRSLREETRRHALHGGDWRDIVESIRPLSPAIWTSWSPREKRRFLRHLQAFWTAHRYRVPPQTAAVYERLEGAGRIARHRGTVTAAARCPDGRLRVEISGANGTSAVTVSSAINCTGPNGDYERIRHPLVRNLVRRGVIRPDALRLGVDATPDLHVVDRRGHAHAHLFALGPPLRGLFYETTAVPETCEQAARIARVLVAEFSASRLEAAS